MNGYFCFKSTIDLTCGIYQLKIHERFQPPSSVVGSDRMQSFKVSFPKFRELQPWLYSLQ